MIPGALPTTNVPKGPSWPVRLGTVIAGYMGKQHLLPFHLLPLQMLPSAYARFCKCSFFQSFPSSNTPFFKSPLLQMLFSANPRFCKCPLLQILPSANAFYNCFLPQILLLLQLLPSSNAPFFNCTIMRNDFIFIFEWFYVARFAEQPSKKFSVKFKTFASEEFSI